MKTRTLSIAIIAALMAGAMVSCGCGAKQNEQVICGGMGIGTDEETAEAMSLPRLKTDIGHARFYAAMPEGWNVLDTLENAVIVTNGTVEDDFINGPCATIEVVEADGKTPTAVIAEMVSGAGATAGDDVKIVDHTYQTCTRIEDAYNHQLLVRQEGDKLIKIDIINTDADNPEVRAIVHSVELR